MEFNKLRLLGFKSFVEPTEFVIEKGLTGVVGPNGCGKSNLVEALRWVMGENSYKNMRASSMDDVIFSGSGSRPARNMAEVSLFLDNLTREAPAAFNDTDELQVSRRIEREAGSVYRINGRDVRAKDVQLLFADVSTGARSPSMIGQGRIGELISAKPQARRALLEEAAGISGLHSRRHEAELRLRAADSNLERLDDVLAQLDTQLDSLKRQARQATRYRNLAGDIRRAEATILHLRWIAAKTQLSEAERALQSATVSVGEATLVQTETAKVQAILAARLPELRKREAEAAAALQHLVVTRNQLEAEARRQTERLTELRGRATQLEADTERERRMLSEHGDILGQLEREECHLNAQTEGKHQQKEETRAKLDAANAELADNEIRLSKLTQEAASATALANQNARILRDGVERRNRLENQIASVESDLADLGQQIGAENGVDAKIAAVAAAEEVLKEAQISAGEAEAAVEQARTGEQEARAPLAQARTEHERIETEAKTLSRFINASGQDLFAPVIDRIKVEQGFEKALGAALGEDLDLSTDTSAPAHWVVTDRAGDPTLPAGIAPLSEKVTAPEELSRRLAQVGIVSAADGERLASLLKPGQRLISVEGDLWRWDGLHASAEAPTAAALKLEQKNRLVELDAEAVAALKLLRSLEKAYETSKVRASQATETDRIARETSRTAQSSLDQARRDLVEAERASGQLVSRRAALEEARVRLRSSLDEVSEMLAEAETVRATLPDTHSLEAETQLARSATGNQRARVAQLRAEFEGLARENTLRLERLEAIGRERESWRERAGNAEQQIRTLEQRLAETRSEIAVVVEAPDELDQQRRSLLKQIDAAEAERKTAADMLAACENDQRQADQAATIALNALSDAKQTSARAEERVDAAQERRAEIEARIREELECQPHEAAGQAGLEGKEELPDVSAVEKKLERYRGERERLGAVNLRAEEEQREITEQRDDLIMERDDLIEAIRQLRTGIAGLNREGRERLLAAFDEVNAQFQKLFTHLFSGGTAELQLVESDDPLEAGLEILARPPGKKPQTMTLLSGGEQALTALALIFAVFLTNPAPICVLDEVDAPLDDSNVERFCNLMDQMSAETNTRFVIITHNPITMARMNRLFGVTMAERGVSQLVSVDLETAESYREAG